MKPKDINTKNKSSVSSSYRNPTDEEFWSAIRKILSYEEPSHKWSQLNRMARRHVDKKMFEQLPLATQNKIFAQIFGVENPLFESIDKSWLNFDRIFSALVAYEDLKRFERLAFDMWYQTKELHDAKICNQEFLSQLLGEKMERFQTSEIAWLDFWVSNSFAWHKLFDHEFSKIEPAVGAGLSRILQGFRDRLKADSKLKPISVWVLEQQELRKLFSGGFLCEKVLLVEGQTEIILLPALAKLLNIDLIEISAYIDPCGGAQQVAKQYLNLRDTVSLPILCLLDGDAIEQAELISDSLRDCDRLLTLRKGEIEDLFLEETIFRCMQVYLSEMGYLDSIVFEDIQNSSEAASEGKTHRRVEILDRLCRSRGLGDFDKVAFAKILAEKIEKPEVPEEAKVILRQLKDLDLDKRGLRFND